MPSISILCRSNEMLACLMAAANNAAETSDVTHIKQM